MPHQAHLYPEQDSPEAQASGHEDANRAPQQRTAYNPATGNIEYQQYDPATGQWNWTGTVASRPPAGNSQTVINEPLQSQGVYTREEMDAYVAERGGKWNDAHTIATFPDKSRIKFDPIKNPRTGKTEYNPTAMDPDKATKAPTAFDTFAESLNTLGSLRTAGTAGGATQGSGGTAAPPPPGGVGAPGTRPGEYIRSLSGASIGQLDPRQELLGGKPSWANVNAATLGFDPQQILAAMGIKPKGNPLEVAEQATKGQALRETYAAALPRLSPADIQSRFFDDTGYGANNNRGFDPRPQSSVSRSADPNDTVILSAADIERMFMARGGDFETNPSRPIDIVDALTKRPIATAGWTNRERVSIDPVTQGNPAQEAALSALPHAEGFVNPPPSWSPPERPRGPVSSTDIAATASGAPDPLAQLRDILMLILGGGMGQQGLTNRPRAGGFLGPPQMLADGGQVTAGLPMAPKPAIVELMERMFLTQGRGQRKPPLRPVGAEAMTGRYV